MSKIGTVFSKLAAAAKAIGRGVKTAAQAIGHAFIVMFGNETAASFAREAEKLLGSAFGKVVLSVVSGLMNVAATQGGQSAMVLALGQIGAAAKEAGLNLKESFIRLLIELAVQKLKGTWDAVQALTGATDA